MKSNIYLTICFSVLFAFATYADDVRTWGREHKIEAELVKIADDGKSVTLRQKSGTVITVPLADLSSEDNAYVKGQRAASDQTRGIPRPSMPVRINGRQDFTEELCRNNLCNHCFFLIRKCLFTISTI